MRRHIALSAPQLVLAVSLTLCAARAAAQDDELPPILRANPFVVKNSDEELTRLLKARYNAALEQALGRYKELIAGKTTTDFMIQAATYLRDAGLEVNARPHDQVALLAQIAELARSVEKINRAKYEAGSIALTQMAQARHFRLDAEIRLLRARRAAAKAK
jgi:hypothetical protein